MNQDYERFKLALLTILAEIVPSRNQGDFDEGVHPDTGVKFISFTWHLSEEGRVDSFLKAVRNRLLIYPRLSDDDVTDGFMFEIWKSHIQSHDYWSLTFWLADKYTFTEDSQP